MYHDETAEVAFFCRINPIPFFRGKKLSIAAFDTKHLANPKTALFGPFITMILDNTARLGSLFCLYWQSIYKGFYRQPCWLRFTLISEGIRYKKLKIFICLQSVSLVFIQRV